jgi:lipopolysaccharide biosynthesis protein
MARFSLNRILRFAVQMKAVRDAGAFDHRWYRNQYRDLSGGYYRLLFHYFRVGWKQGRDPSPDFDTEFYLETYPDVDPKRWNPLAHYIRFGEREQRVPMPGSNREIVAPDLTPAIEHRPNARVAVVMHVFYPELWTEMAAGLDGFAEPVDLFVTLTEDRSEHLQEAVRARFPDAHCFVFPNHGRDIWPFVELHNTGVLDRYELVCKVHSKRSLHRDDGSSWRQHLLSSLMGEPEQTAANLALMRADPDLGLLCPSRAITGSMHWGSCRNLTARLACRVDVDIDQQSLAFPAGSMFWCRPFALRLLRSMQLGAGDFQAERNQLDGTTAHAVERLFGLLTEASGLRLAETDDVESALALAKRNARARPQRPRKVIAFYLPQFHPIPENDRWWGAGFTEWTNLMRGRPMFRGHHQPRIPGELGFYDLRLPETREAQAELAREHGLHGFCYYYYWFGGKKLLDRPLNEVLARGSPDFPFCICWANENWTRRWDGREKDVLIAQDYNEQTNRALIRDVIPIFRDPRYITFDGKPVFVVYRITKIPDFVEVVAMWRQECRDAGIGEIHLAAVRFDQEILDGPPERYGIDAYIDFPPHGARVETVHHRLSEVDPSFRGMVYSYDSVVSGDLGKYRDGYRYNLHRGLMLAWDNTPRKVVNAHVCHMANPAKFRRWLREVFVQEDRFRPEGESMVFVNAWNEWAEGTYLEPDRRWGRGFLEALRSALTPPRLETAAASQERPPADRVDGRSAPKRAAAAPAAVAAFGADRAAAASSSGRGRA